MSEPNDMAPKNLLDVINKCYCVNLAERTDRWEKVILEIEKLQKVKPNIELVRVDAIKNEKNPKYGLNQTLTQIIKDAKERGDDMVLFIEDDLEFLSINKLVTCLTTKNIPNDWDVLSGGSYQSRNTKAVNPHWATTESFCSMHFMIIKQSMYDFFINPGCPETKHIDRWLEETIRKNKKKYFIMNPMPVRQSAGYSNLRKTKVDDNKRKGLNWHTKDC